jgi:hypothetical protein
MATAMMMMLELPNQTRDVRALRDAGQLHRALIISLISIPSPAPSVYMIVASELLSDLPNSKNYMVVPSQK